jgi:4-hydroxy-3-polyprenylbenzoate decarboxylase
VLPLVSQGPQPHELETVYAALARLLKPLARGLVPQLVDYSVAAGAGTGRLLTAAIRKRQAFDSRQAAGLLWGWGHWLQARLLILVDEWVDVHDLREVLLAVAAHLRPERDVWSLAGPEEWYDDGPGSSLHHALVLDATCKSAADAAAPGRMVRDPSIGQRVERLLQGVTAERVAQQRG